MKNETLNTIQIPVREFAKKLICDGHLFFITKEGRKFYLMKPGVFIDPAFIKKHATQGTTFDYSPVVNEEIKNKFIQHFKELRYFQFEKDLRRKAIEILQFFESVYSGDEHFLTFALAAQEVFCAHPVTLLEKMHETDLYLFRKALYSASFSVIIGMANDYYHPLLLKDFFNLTMALDVGLCDVDYSYYVSQACNQENQKPGTGLEWLTNQKASPSEINVFIGHPEKSYQALKEAKELLSYPELAEVALYQHELSDGKGFPRGIQKGLISNWESVVILADSMVEIQDEYEFEKDVMEYILNFQSKKMADIPVARVYKKLCDGLLYFKSIKENAS